MPMSKDAQKSILICLTPSLGPTWERGCITYIFVALSIFRVLTHATNKSVQNPRSLCWVACIHHVTRPPLEVWPEQSSFGQKRLHWCIGETIDPKHSSLEESLSHMAFISLVGFRLHFGPKVSAGLTGSRNPFTSKYLKCLVFCNDAWTKYMNCWDWGQVLAVLTGKGPRLQPWFGGWLG